MAQMILERPTEYAISIGHNLNDYEGLIDKLREIRNKITPEMHEILNKYEDNSRIRKTLLKAIPKEGSYHRGSLVSIVSASNGKLTNHTLSAAAELFYWATAWLDDISDENTFRQGANSIRQSAGNNIAMYASNALYGIVLRSITDQFMREPEKLAEIIKYFSENFHVINRGQAIDAIMAEKHISEVSIDDYISLIEETTGVDVATNLCIGTIAAELDEKTTDNLYKFGKNLGTLAQIRDDVLDYCDIKYDGSYVIGKLPFRDLETGKKRLPLLLTQNKKEKVLTRKVYDEIEKKFIIPRKKAAKKYLSESGISSEAKDLLERILEYWSDIRLFQEISVRRNLNN